MRKLILEKLKAIDFTAEEWDKFMFGGTNIRVLDFNDIPDSLLLNLYSDVLKHPKKREMQEAVVLIDQAANLFRDLRKGSPFCHIKAHADMEHQLVGFIQSLYPTGILHGLLPSEKLMRIAEASTKQVDWIY